MVYNDQSYFIRFLEKNLSEKDGLGKEQMLQHI